MGVNKTPPVPTVPLTPTADEEDKDFTATLQLEREETMKSSDFFRFLGRLFGKALFDRQLIDFPLSSLILKHMLGGMGTAGNSGGRNIIKLDLNSKLPSKSVQKGKSTEESAMLEHNEKLQKVQSLLEELKNIDSSLYKSLHWIVNNDITNIIFEQFSIQDCEKEIPLCAGGEDIEVTESNKLDYVLLMITWKTKFSVSKSLFPFLEGFHEAVPLHHLTDVGFTVYELNLILNGKPKVDVEELRAYCMYQGRDNYQLTDDESAASTGVDESLLAVFDEQHDSVVWLWAALRQCKDSERRAVLQFFTGSSCVPLDGYNPSLNITDGSSYMEKDSLPRAHTCFNQLVLPAYSSFEKLKEKLLFAAFNTEGFQLA